MASRLGVAPNGVAPSAEAELLFRTTGPGSEILERLAALRAQVEIEEVLEVPPVRLRTVPGFEATKPITGGPWRYLRIYSEGSRAGQVARIRSITGSSIEA